VHKNNNVLGLFIVNTQGKIDEWNKTLSWLPIPSFRKFANQLDEYKVMKIVRH